MCKFCNFLEDNDGFAMEISEVQQDRHNGEYFQMEKIDDNDFSLYLFTDIQNGASHKWFSMEVYFCPLCGKKL